MPTELPAVTATPSTAAQHADKPAVAAAAAAGPPAATTKRVRTADGTIEVRGKAKLLLDRIVWLGEQWQDAARSINMNLAAARKVLARPHCVRYLNQQRQVFRTAASAQNIRRAVEIRDQDDNRTAAMQAIRYLDGMADEEKSAANRIAAPGVVVVVNTQRDDRKMTDLEVIEVNPLTDKGAVTQEDA